MGTPLEDRTTEELYQLWSEYDGTNMPDGWDGADILIELQRRGEPVTV